MRTTKGAALAAGALVLGLAPAIARAGGFEYPENGSIAMGRGGASVARASDPTAIMLNTANIVGVDGVQITVSSNLAFLNNCYTRGSGTLGPMGQTVTPGGYQGPNQNVAIDTMGTPFYDQNSGEATYANSSMAMPYNYPQVCNTAPPFVAPQLLATWRLNRYFAIGLGVYGPNAVGQQSFPLTVTAAPGVMAPTPIRYMLMSENLIVIHPTLALAGAPFPWLRLGVGLQPSFADFTFTTMANAASSQSPSQDLLTAVEANTFFFAFNAGIQLIAPRYFSVGAQLHWNPDTITLTGTNNAHATFNPYRTNTLHPGEPLCDFANPSRLDPMNCSTFTSKVTAHLPWSVKWGVRFALPRGGAAGPLDPHYDPMRDDVFDIEIDWMYEHTSAFTALELTNMGSLNAGGTMVPAPGHIVVPHNLHDTWGIRLGSDINIIPNLFALRLGASYETGGESVLTGQIDQPSYTTLGLHAGASVRIANHLTVSVAYGHFFMQDLNVYRAPGQNLTELGATGALTEQGCRTSAGADACATNVGHYQASMDVVNLGLTARF